MNERKRESLFLAIERFARHADALRQFSEDVFLLVAAEFPLGRQAGDRLDEHRIEDGDADLQRIQHAHAINLGEDVADHIGLGIDVEELAHGVVIPGGRMPKITAQNISGIVAAVENLAKIVREERCVTLEGGQKGHAVDVTFLPGQRNVVTEFTALHAVGQTWEDLVPEKLAGPSGYVFKDLAAGVDTIAIVSGKHFVATSARKSDP